MNKFFEEIALDSYDDPMGSLLEILKDKADGQHPVYLLPYREDVVLVSDRPLVDEYYRIKDED